MDIQNYLENRKKGEHECERIVGKNNVAKLSTLCEDSIELIKDIETGIIYSVMEESEFTSEEIKLYKIGVRSVSAFLEQCKAERELIENIKKQEKEDEERKKTKRHY